MEYFVYAIGKKGDLKEPYVNCYIGVTNNPELRFKSHARSTSKIGKFIREHDLKFRENFKIIFEGKSDDCFMIEEEMRPFPNMGLNVATGGCGGHTRYSEERNSKISDAMKGRDVTWGDKVSKTKLENGTHKGRKNPRAKKWYLTSPDGKCYDATGKLAQICEDLGLTMSILRKNLGKTVEPPKMEGYGGFRPKSDDERKIRMNTVGWKLSEGEMPW